MRASELARRGYTNTLKQMGSDIELELKIFTDITGRLAGADIAKPGGISALSEAVADNARLRYWMDYWVSLECLWLTNHGGKCSNL